MILYMIEITPHEAGTTLNLKFILCCSIETQGEAKVTTWILDFKARCFCLAGPASTPWRVCHDYIDLIR